jgi:hypothetical protein
MIAPVQVSAKRDEVTIFTLGLEIAVVEYTQDF